MSQLLQARGDTPTAAAVFLRQLFATLDEHGCSYAVMRNYEQLPDSLGGSDLDALVAPAALLQAHDLAEQVATANGAVVIGSVRGRGFCQLHVLGAGFGCRIDLFPSANFDGHDYAAIDWQRDVRRHRGVAVLRRDLGNLLAVVKSMLTHGTAPARYAAAIRELPRQAPAEFERWLAPIGARARGLVAAALANGTAGPVREAARSLRTAVRRHQLWPRPLAWLRRGLGWQCSKLRRFLRPSGAVIAVLGVDGVGKSTLLRDVLPALQAATHGACTVLHLRPGLLPAPARLLRRRPVQGANVDPHAAAPSGVVGSLLRTAWLLADYALGYWLRVRPLTAKLPGIVLFDRYAYDLGIDPRRFRIGLPPRLLGWLAQLAPRPDLTICLYASPRTILQRKQELPAAEVQRQLDALRAFAARSPLTARLCTDGTPEQVRDDLLALLHSFFAARREHGGR